MAEQVLEGGVVGRQYLTNPIFDIVGRVADTLGLRVYVVGGFVRDLLLGSPSDDIDFVVEGSGIDLAREVARAISPRIEVACYRNFGTAMFRYADTEVEFVGARRESYNRSSRNPVVEDGTLHDDQLRRDFTVNAMAISLNADTRGRLLDPFDGLGDLDRKVIRTPRPADVTFDDDPLRMLRAVRFAARLGFAIDPDALEAIRRNAARVEILSKERINDELNKMLLGDHPSTAFKLMSATGLLRLILPELEGLKGIEVREGWKHKDNFYHTLEVVDNVARAGGGLWLRWAALLHDVAKASTKRFNPKTGWTFHGHEYVGALWVPRIFRRMKMPANAHMKFVQKMVGLHMRPIVLAQDEVTDSAVRRLLFEAGDDIEQLLVLCDADITSKNPEKVSRYLDNYRLVRRKMVELEERDRVRNFQPPVTGQMIMRCFGLEPCRAVGDLKDAIKDAILDGVIENDLAQAWAFMLARAAEKGLKPVDPAMPAPEE